MGRDYLKRSGPNSPYGARN